MSKAARKRILDSAIVYGPVESRRLGLSLGINVLLSGPKLCNFNCPYCQYGWTARSIFPPVEAWPSPATIAAALSRRLRQAETRGERFDHLTIAGRGEPTLHHQFGSVVRRLKAVRDRIVPGTPLAVLTNSSTVLLPSIRAALLELDECHMKLDAGDPITMNRLNGTRIPVARIVAALADLPHITIQAMFVRDPLGVMDNTSARVVGSWLDAVVRIRPAAVHLYTLDRPPACEFLRPASTDLLREVATRVEEAGIAAYVFPAAPADDFSEVGGDFSAAGQHSG